MADAPGRQRFRVLVLLVAAAFLVVWFFTPADPQDPATSGESTDATSSATPTDDTTGFPPTGAAETEDPDSGLPIVRVDDLPPEVADTIELILAGGPFPEPDHDGGTFGNREELLPDRPSGYYREYTVPTPGSDDRGARRIVAGDDGELYYTGDHYDSFSRIAT
ncbi:ribonuclease domain-containing protein [Nocardioides hwasunensis]|uniref:Ribonuclease n=1 Tax=Nocardioides hwasunensis TaxID=397258 RepID=A0ABR8MBC2_9ACTN|nr:ribonuclease domain-containing protein [Nocardioides hwasunensis]MBD3913436.1 ribonuclease [Nocardioides hwasunensis]